jgi:hypothetical protein
MSKKTKEEKHTRRVAKPRRRLNPWPKQFSYPNLPLGLLPGSTPVEITTCNGETVNPRFVSALFHIICAADDMGIIDLKAIAERIAKNPVKPEGIK